MFYFAVVVISSAIVVFFLEEIRSVFKKLFTNPGDHLIFFLGTVSAIVVAYEEYLTVVFNWLCVAQKVLLTNSVTYFPALAGLRPGSVIGLFCLASLPAWLVFWLMRYNQRSSAAVIAGQVYLFVWVFCVVLALAG